MTNRWHRWSEFFCWTWISTNSPIFSVPPMKRSDWKKAKLRFSLCEKTRTSLKTMEKKSGTIDLKQSWELWNFVLAWRKEKRVHSPLGWIGRRLSLLLSKVRFLKRCLTIKLLIQALVKDTQAITWRSRWMQLGKWHNPIFSTHKHHTTITCSSNCNSSNRPRLRATTPIRHRFQWLRNKVVLSVSFSWGTVWAMGWLITLAIWFSQCMQATINNKCKCNRARCQFSQLVHTLRRATSFPITCNQSQFNKAIRRCFVSFSTFCELVIVSRCSSSQEWVSMEWEALNHLLTTWRVRQLRWAIFKRRINHWRWRCRCNNSKLLSRCQRQITMRSICIQRVMTWAESLWEREDKKLNLQATQMQADPPLEINRNLTNWGMTYKQEMPARSIASRRTWQNETFIKNELDLVNSKESVPHITDEVNTWGA